MLTTALSVQFLNSIKNSIILTKVLEAVIRDVASGADRHLDIGLQVVEAHPLFPYFLEKRLAIPTSPFFIY